MHIHDATECAYKNGYDTGVKEFAERLKKFNESLYSPFKAKMINEDIDTFLKEMTGNDNKRLTMPDDYHFEVGV